MEEAPENGKESLHSASAKGMNEYLVAMKTCNYNNLGMPHSITQTEVIQRPSCFWDVMLCGAYW